MQHLTAALTDFAGGDWSRRLDAGRHHEAAARDEVQRAVDAFNHMANQLEENRDRLVHLTRMASWQTLSRTQDGARAEELADANPFPVEEMQARHPASERAFMDQAVQIVVSDRSARETHQRFPNSRASRSCIRRFSTSTLSSPNA